MRDLTSDQEARLFSTSRNVYHRVRVADPSGTLVDYTVAGGSTYDWVNRWTITGNVDEAAVAASIEFHRQNDVQSLAPYLQPGTEAIKAGRRVTIEYAAINLGESLSESDYWLLFDGYVDGWKTEGRGGTLTLECRDRMGLLVDTWTIAENTYGNSVTPVQIQSVMRSILNERFSGTETFTTIGDPDFGILEYSQKMESMYDALKANFDLIGWLFRYRYDASSAGFRFEFLEPDRTIATPQHTIRPTDYYDIPSFEESSDDLRNEGVIKWGGGKVTAQDETSIAEYGRTKTIVLDASQDDQINTEAKAVALVTAVVSDLSQPLAKKQAILPLAPFAQINDYYRFTPNSALYSQDQDMAVTGFQHSYGPDGEQTRLDLRGKPSGGVTRWDALRDRLDEANVPEATTTTLEADDIQFYYTTAAGSLGFVNAGTAAGSLGGWASTTTVSDAVNGLFRKVSETERVSSVTLYRSVAVINESASPVPIDWECVFAYLSEQASSGVTWAFALDPQGIYPAAELYSCISPDEESPPACSPALTWYSPVGSSASDVQPSADGETIVGGSGRIVHIRLVVSSGATRQTTDDSLVFSDQVPVAA